jgi:cytoskeletal protein CcmA (bactofilin family)
MFHRMKSEAPQATTPPQQPQPQNAPSPAQAEAKANDAKQNSAAEQSRNTPQAAQAQKPEPQQSTPSKQEEAKSMTTPQTPSNTSTPASGEDFNAPRALDIPVSPYQRPGQAPVRSGAGYPGAYPATAYPARAGAAPGAAAAPAGDRRLLIGRGITISGEIESCDHIVVEGTVEAALKGATVLEIAEQGVFYGTVEIEEATVAGRFEGDITVHGRLTIRASGTITGSISYKELEVEAGAIIDGRLTPAGSENRAKQGGKGKSGKKDTSNDDGLFSTKAAAE